MAGHFTEFALLLFLMGLKLDLQHVRHIGPVALATGLGQLGFTILFGFILILLMGKDWITVLYVAVALTFSSTIIIKLLSDTGNWPWRPRPRGEDRSMWWCSAWAVTVGA